MKGIYITEQCKQEIESKIETLQNDNEALLNEINTVENILNNQ